MSALCSYCGKQHPVSLCPHTWGGSVARTHLRCTYCGSTQHAVKFCPHTYSGNSNRRQEPNGEFID